MSRARPLRVVVALALGAILLASCGSSPAPRSSAVHLTGTPALSFATPLSSVSCTVNDVCVAIGATSTGSGPTSVAEFATPHGNWFNLALPSSASILLTSVGCNGAQCLVAGSSPGADVLWLFDSHTHDLSALTPPAGGIGVSALSCNQLVCALIDTGANGVPRFSTSTDAGVTWTDPSPLHFAKGAVVADLSCPSAVHCALGVATSTSFSLYVTNDAGQSWQFWATPSSWNVLNSLTCTTTTCVGVATTDQGSLLVRSKKFAVNWRSTTLLNTASSVACTQSTSCAIAGEQGGDAWLALVHQASLRNVKLKYVPSPLLDVACGAKVCAAIAVTTLVSFPLSS
ncbi:MAG TPA: hypothetical protein VGG21_08115 [Acidimicrobiales bacterium]